MKTTNDVLYNYRVKLLGVNAITRLLAVLSGNLEEFEVRDIQEIQEKFEEVIKRKLGEE